MKKIFSLLCVLFITLSLTACSNNDNFNIKDNDITYGKMLIKMDNKEDFVVMIGFENCPWCSALSPILSDVASNKEIKFYYLDTFEDSGDEIYKDSEKSEFDVFLDKVETIFPDKQIYVPLVLYIQNGEIVNYHLGTLPEHNAHENDLSFLQTIKLRINLANEFEKSFK